MISPSTVTGRPSEQGAGFTLVELLVVISIIVVLLAIALPALDRAIVSASMAKCGANLKSIATSVQTYAVANRRSYPYRATINQHGTRVPRIIAYEGTMTAAGYDDRAYLKGYVELDSLLDPMLEEIDLDPEANNDNVEVFSNYALWFGMYYSGGGAFTRMGGKLSFRNVTSGQSHSFRILASDFDAFQINTAYRSQASHPDDEVLQELSSQNTGGLTWAMWYSPSTEVRGVIDTNYVGDDGAVQRYNDVTYDEAPLSDTGPRFFRVPYGTNSTASLSDYWVHLPRGN